MSDQFTAVEITERLQLGEKGLGEVQGLPDALTERIVSRPPSGSRQIFNFYYNPATERFVIVIEGASETETQTISFKITELAQVITTLTKTLLEQEAIGEPLADDYTAGNILEILEDDFDVEL